MSTDSLGHQVFATSNEDGVAVAAEIFIEAGKALEMKALAAAYLKRTGQYFNPVADSEEAEGSLTLTTTLAALGFALSSILI